MYKIYLHLPIHTHDMNFRTRCLSSTVSIKQSWYPVCTQTQFIIKKNWQKPTINICLKKVSMHKGDTDRTRCIMLIFDLWTLISTWATISEAIRSLFMKTTSQWTPGFLIDACAYTRVLDMWLFCVVGLSNSQNPYNGFIFDDIWSVTLTFELETWIFRVAHRLMVLNNYAKLFKKKCQCIREIQTGQGV